MTTLITFLLQITNDYQLQFSKKYRFNLAKYKKIESINPPISFGCIRIIIKKIKFIKWLWMLPMTLCILFLMSACEKKEDNKNDTGDIVMEESDVIIEEMPNNTSVPESGTFAESFRRYLANDARDPQRSFLMNIAFPVNGAIPIGTSIADVKALIDIMREHLNLSIAIEGYTSSSGNAAQNQQLSEQRAEAVRDLLVAAGIDGNRVSAMGMGTITPLSESSDEAAKLENHRIAVRVIN
ncbi:MAG: OmpA family protein [Gammaproteobacteria bacterium]|nr:OmpA family protein [Gammaproteobacteria bacterium]